MNRRNKLITIITIIVIILIGLGFGLYFGLKNNSNNSNNSNSSNSQTPPLNIQSSNHPIEKWSQTMCNQYIAACQDNINKGLVPNTAMHGCLEITKAHEC